MGDRFDDLIDSADMKLKAGAPLSKDEANAHIAQGLFNPTNQVYFRAGLIACREYMARFVEAQSPEIAASIRANWWPAKLGQDFGPPRQMAWSELVEGEYVEGEPIKMRPDISPTLEGLPIALHFLQTAHEPPSNEVFRMPLVASAPGKVIGEALALLDEAARLRDVGDIGARDLERRARELLRGASGVAVTDASQLKQPHWGHVMQAFGDGAREARANPEASEHDFGRAADGYTKRVFAEADPEGDKFLNGSAAVGVAAPRKADDPMATESRVLVQVPAEATPEMLREIALRFAFVPQEEDLDMAAEAWRAALRACGVKESDRG